MIQEEGFDKKLKQAEDEDIRLEKSQTSWSNDDNAGSPFFVNASKISEVNKRINGFPLFS